MKEPVLRIHDILRRIPILVVGSVHWITDPAPDLDPVRFVSGFQDANKNKFIPQGFLLITLSVGTFTSVFRR